MKILYVGVTHENSGWSNACFHMIRALASVGHDVVVRPHLISPRNIAPPPDILQLEQKSSQGCEHCIQHTLPHSMDYHGDFKKNVAVFCSETSDFKSSVWATKLNLMDECWVPHQQGVDAARRSGVNVPISVVPYPCDTSRYGLGAGILEPLKQYRDQGDFLFYYIGENIRRKNIPSLVRAFHLEFDPSENVQLLLKTTGNKKGVEDLCVAVKRGLKLYANADYYKQELIITERLSDADLLRLHRSCDCFVMPSCGESWSLPCFDSMAMGRTPIAPNSTGFKDYLTEAEGYLVKTNEAPVFEATDTLGDIFTARETWQVIDVIDLRKRMREAFEDTKQRKVKAANGIDKAFSYSYITVGLLMTELLNATKENDSPGRSQQAMAGPA